MRDRGWWAGAGINGANTHIVPLRTDRGLTPAVATGVFGVMGLSTLISRPFVGLLLDRIFAPYVATAFLFVPLAGLPLLAGGSRLLLPIGAALLGLAPGAEIDLIAFLTTRYLGQRCPGPKPGACSSSIRAYKRTGRRRPDPVVCGLDQAIRKADASPSRSYGGLWVQKSGFQSRRA